MGNISQISVDGETHKVKDAEARDAANSALTTANEAKTAADEAVAAANNKISKDGGEEEATTIVNFQNGIKLGSIPVSYNVNNNTITFG